MKKETIKISDIIHNEEFKSSRNPYSIEKLVMSICEFGQVMPILVTPKFEIINGHNRVLAMQKLGFTTITAKIIEFDESKRKRN
jgi:ParB-like chromosome segregation protein Spo0J